MAADNPPEEDVLNQNNNNETYTASGVIYSLDDEASAREILKLWMDVYNKDTAEAGGTTIEYKFPPLNDFMYRMVQMEKQGANKVNLVLLDVNHTQVKSYFGAQSLYNNSTVQIQHYKRAGFEMFREIIGKTKNTIVVFVTGQEDVVVPPDILAQAGKRYGGIMSKSYLDRDIPKLMQMYLKGERFFFRATDEM